jgi:hypothetical protein
MEKLGLLRRRRHRIVIVDLTRLADFADQAPGNSDASWTPCAETWHWSAHTPECAGPETERESGPLG